MFCGVPVVCFNSTSISEIVDHKKNGFVVDSLSSEALLDGIDWVSEELKKGDLIKKDAIKKISNYDPKFIANKYIKLYKKISDEQNF